MVHILRLSIIFPLIFFSLTACLQESLQKGDELMLLSGARQTSIYIPLLEGKKVGLVANHSSFIGSTHLADTLLTLGVDIKRVFAPEHGFRGMADAGEHIKDGIDTISGLQVVSLYGSNRKPNAEDLRDLNVIIFDIQDVGVRFYTFISTLSYVMEAAAEQDIEVIVFDRPNPNGFYIDGPVMEDKYSSFVGLHPVPVVYGMTIGEYGRMVNGEKWLANGINCNLTIIPLKNYDRSELYKLPVKPSPNLPSWQSVYLYPSLCLFEGTIVSVGRGTDFPFTVYGHPRFHLGSFAFIPEPGPGAKHPKLAGEQCYGQNLNGYANHYKEVDSHFNLLWILSACKYIGADSGFFNSYFEKLVGNGKLREQISSGMDQKDIKASWQDDLNTFKAIREKYLLYEDFD